MNLLSSDCCGQSRRDFLKTTAGLAAACAVGSVPLIGRAAVLAATSETLVATLYKSLREEQRKALCFSFDHPLRTEVDNNWHITDQHISAFLDKDQNQMVKDIFLGLHSRIRRDRAQTGRARQRRGGLRRLSIALRRARHGKFEFVLTGRHCTRRCDGDSVEGAAFGGPIFYGHAAEGFNEKPDHPGNVYCIRPARERGFPDARWQTARSPAAKGRTAKPETVKPRHPACPALPSATFQPIKKLKSGKS